MRGVNGGSCRHDTPAQNSLLLQEGTEESFSLSSSLFFSFAPEMCHSLLLSCRSLFNCRCCLYFLSLSCIPTTSITHRKAHTHQNDLWHFEKSQISLYVPYNNHDPHTQTHANALTNNPLLFLPHCASKEPPTGALGEVALQHSMTELLCWCQAGMLWGTSPFSIPEALQARGVPQIQHKHSTWGERTKSLRKNLIWNLWLTVINLLYWKMFVDMFSAKNELTYGLLDSGRVCKN